MLNLYLIIIINTYFLFLIFDFHNIKIKNYRIYGILLSLTLIYFLYIYKNNIYNFQCISSFLGFNLGIDGISLLFIILTTILIPLSIIANWNTIKFLNIYIYLILLLEILLIILFMLVDILSFFIIFEITLPCLFLFIGIGGNKSKINASFYIFIYTMLGSLFLLVSILFILNIIGGTDFYSLFNSNFSYIYQSYIFIGMFIAFAVKTPLLPLHIWLLKAHVESPLSGSIILAGIILKLSVYGIIRLIIPITPKALFNFNVYLGILGVITIIIISISTIRSSDIKELIAYSSITHAAVYILGIISNNIQGIEGGIILSLGHGFVSPALFIITGGILYDRYHSRDINSIRGIIQLMPLLSFFFFLFTLSNCGIPLSLNFIGEFLSLYAFFEKLPLLALLASISIIFSAVYSIFLYNRVVYGYYLNVSNISILDISKKEILILLMLIILTFTGIYPCIFSKYITYTAATKLY